MKKTSIITAAVASVSLMAASVVSAAPITMTGVTADQVLTLSGCKTYKVPSITVTVTLDDSDHTYTIKDSGANTVLKGTWFKLAGKTPTSPYTIYMAADVFAPAPDNADVMASPDPTIPPPAGTLDDFLDQANGIAQNSMTCKLNTKKPPFGTQSVTLIQPSILVATNTLKVTTAKDGVTKSGTLIVKTNNGKATTLFSGSPKTGVFSTTLTIKGTVVEN